MTQSQNDLSISVVMATCNGEPYIVSQITSILSQLMDTDEIIVSDDHSSDSTLRLINELNDPRVRVISPKVPLGPAANFEHGLYQAKNDIVILSDQDDVWLSGRAEAIRNHFKDSHARYELLVLNSRVVDKGLATIAPSVFELMNSGPGLLKNIYRNTYIGCHMAFRRALLQVALPFPIGIPMHDVWLGLLSELMGPVWFSSDVSMLFRRTGENFTRARYNWRTRFKWRVNLVRLLIVFIIFKRPASIKATER